MKPLVDKSLSDIRGEAVHIVSTYNTGDSHADESPFRSRD